MGLSSKLVSTDGFDWSPGLLKIYGGLEIPKPAIAGAQPIGQQKQQQQRRRQQHQGPPLRCPRCDSTNTKFCYYNNYSRSQPRHFCKACRRHWTEGGTLRNVPVGGGRKTKRLKTTHQPIPANSTDNHPTTTSTGSVRNSNHIPTIQQQPLPALSFVPNILCQALLQPSPPPSDYTNIGNNTSGGGGYLGSLLSLPPVPQFGSATAGMMSSYDCTDSYPFSTPSSPPTFFDFTGQEDLGEQDIAAELGGSMATATAPWQMLPPPPCGSGGTSTTTATPGSSLALLDSSSFAYWDNCWYDLTTGFLSPDLKHPPPQHSQLP